MCDTIYLKSEGRAFIGKNSDRSPNEAHIMIRVPAKDYDKGAEVKTTYIAIPQARHTYSCVLLKPHWIWGAEMGWNEHGLNIGNEALFTTAKREKTEGLLGMDMLRLALERTKTAAEAVKFIASLLEKYGQGGNCAFDKKFYYDNAFLIADGKECYVMETAGREWAVKKTGDTAAISNCISLGDDYDFCSGGVIGNFKKRYENRLVTAVAGAENRRRCTLDCLRNQKDAISAMMTALKGHSRDDVTVNKSSTNSPCMHAGNLFGDQTTGSYFGEIGKLYFATGSSFPCISVFKPLTPAAAVLPEDEQTALEFWVKRELLNRHVMSGNIDFESYKNEATELQKRFLTAAASAKDEIGAEAISARCFYEDEQFVDKYLAQAKGKNIDIKGGAYFRRYWRKKTKTFMEIYAL